MAPHLLCVSSRAHLGDPTVAGNRSMVYGLESRTPLGVTMHWVFGDNPSRDTRCCRRNFQMGFAIDSLFQRLMRLCLQWGVFLTS